MVAAVADATRQRLIEVGGPLFAEHGYRGTGIKQICDAARCNVASINYHFGSKQAFYAVVLAEAHQLAFVGNPMPQPDGKLPPREEYTTWLRWWLASMLNPDRPTWLQPLMAREMVDPTPALDTMVDRSIRPMYDRLTALIRRMAPKGTSAARIRLCTNSVIAQALVYKHARPVLQRMGAMPSLAPAGMAELIEHVAAFTLAGIAAATARPTPNKNRR
jgi:TetR/AcrR family transcriptional regulator, regulator of cefoperazone and chloramphenicol sensitivity